METSIFLLLLKLLLYGCDMCFSLVDAANSYNSSYIGSADAELIHYKQPNNTITIIQARQFHQQNTF